MIDGAKRTVEERLRRGVRDTFLAQAERIEERLADRSARQERVDDILSVDALFDLSEATKETLEVSQPAFEQALRIGWETGRLRIDDEAPFDADAPWVRRALGRLNRQMRKVPQNTRDIINQVIREGQNDPDKSVEDIGDDITKRLRRMASGTGGPDQSGSVTRSRARRIAATSTTTAFESAQDQAWRKGDVEASSWLSQRDNRVSPGHFEADGQRRDIGVAFDVRRTLDRPKEKVMYPGDPQARPSNVVNCRCSRRPLLDRDTE